MNTSSQVAPGSLRDYMYAQTSGRAPDTNAAQALYTRYLGEPKVNNQPDPYSEQAYTDHSLPEAYKGRRVMLRDTIDGFILDNFEWYTYVIPWFMTSEMTVQFNVYHYNHVPAGPTPNKGISRVITDSQEVFSDRVSRFGLAFMMEGDMMGTEAGNIAYMRSIMGISQGCQELVNQSTIVALLSCKNYFRDWQSRHRRDGDSIAAIMQSEVDEFAALADSRDMLHKIVQARIEMMRRDRAVPDSLIVFPNFPWVSTMVAEGTLSEFNMTGPRGIEVLVQGPAPNFMFRGLAVWTTREFTVHRRGRFVQPLARYTTVGEYYPMVMNQRRRANYLDGSYKSMQRDIYIYNVESDNYEVLSFRDCVQQSRLWAGDYYSKEVIELLHERNAQINKQDGYAAKMHRYGAASQKLLDEQPHRLPGCRDELLVFAHDSEENKLFAADFIGQLDLDVLPSEDLLRMAQTLVASTFGNFAEPTRAALKQVTDLLADIESAPYTEAYFRELSILNAPRSISNDRRWVGERVADGGPRDFVPNEFGSLDLPAYVVGMPTYPAGFANWPGLKTIAATAAASGWGADLQQRAAKAVDTISRLSIEMQAKGINSEFLHRLNTPEWFHVKDFGLALLTSLENKPPIFLAVPNSDGVRRGPNETEPSNNVKSASVVRPTWLPVPDAQYDPEASIFLGAYPLYQWIVIMTEARNADGTVNWEAVRASKLANYLKALVELPGLSFEQREEYRDKLLDALKARIPEKEESPVIIALKIKAIKEFIAKDFAVPPTSAEDVDRLLATLQTYRQTTADKALKKEAAALSEAETARLTAAGELIVRQGVSETETASFDLQNAPANVAAAISELGAQLVAGKKNLLVALSNSVSEVEKLGRKHNNVTEFTWATASEWATHVASSPYLNDAEKNEVVETFSRYQAVLKKMHSVTDAFVKKANLGVATSSAFEDFFEPTGATLRNPVFPEDAAKMCYFRAPLTNTEALVRGTAQQANPFIRPADRDSGFRVVYNPLSNAPLTGRDMAHIFEKPEFTNHMHAAARPFHESPIMMRHLDLAPVAVELTDEATFRAPAELCGSLVDDATFYPEDEGDSHLPKWNSNSARFASHVEQVRERREREGLSDRSFAREMHEAAAIEQDRKRSRTAQQQRERVAAELDRVQFGTHASDARATGHFDPLVAMHAIRTNDNLPAPLWGRGGDIEEDDDDDNNKRRRGDGDRPAKRATIEYERLLRGSMSYRWTKAMQQTNLLVRLAYMQLLLTPISSLTAINELIDNDVAVPFNVIAWRPFIEIEMYSLILLRSGMDTGGNVIGNTNFAMATSNMDKTFFGHYTFYYKCMIWREQNVSHILDVYPKQYKDGWNLTFIRDAAALKRNSDDEKRGSLIATVVAITENTFPAAMCLIDTTVEAVLPATESNRPLETRKNDYSSAPLTARIWGLTEAQARMNDDNCRYNSANNRINVIAYMGTHIGWSDMSHSWNAWTFGSGHLGGNKTGQGAKSIWYGQSNNQFPQQSPALYRF